MDTLTGLVGAKCTNSLLSLEIINDPECLKLFISKGLGIGIVAGGAILKVPQILKIVSRKSGKGISFLGYLLETISFVITVAYNWRTGKVRSL